MRTICTEQFFLMSLYFTVLHTIPAPVNFTILSHNFKHILQWSPGINSPPQTVFSVNRSCNEKKPQRLHKNIRNMTVDVSETFQDIYTSCTFFLWASVDNMTSSIVNKRFTPYEDTIIGPPIIFLSGCGDCLNISISLPSESSEVDQLHQFYNSVNFDINWKEAGENEANLISTSRKQYVLQNLQPGNQYCVKVLPQINFNRNTKPSAWQCEYTSKKEPRGMLYLMSWSLGVSVSGLGLLVLAVSLVYTGSICKPKTPLPKTLGNITEAYFLIPEQTLSERLLLTDSQLIIASKNHPSENNNPLNAVEDPKSKQIEDEENYVNKADTEDEEEDEGNCNYADCVNDRSGWETNNSEVKPIDSVLTLHNSSGIHHTKEIAMEKIHHDEFDCKKLFVLHMPADRSSHLEDKNAELELKGNQDGSADVSGNINLFSVTLRPLGPKDDLDEEACKPLFPKLVESEVQELSTSHISLLERQQSESQDLLFLCSSDLDMRTEHDTMSGYMVTHTGNMHEQNRSFPEGTDCDTDYMSRWAYSSDRWAHITVSCWERCYPSSQLSNFTCTSEQNTASAANEVH
ncbi:cytokine receptor family member b1 isoform X1 [Cyprinus carpio]|uniref:Cytokine receptor family member b1 isoform X1 n=2 Tax=Cyprinus carpio TaxID=7962 RepID=A0A8C1MRU3_CYPCA|nr:cytokine receptor family member b1 isoform X1 [Cyprinus carpio]XP_042586521.1 cytokine receptor family member b1 isoform X1 [Cyprinus carpio]XP_042586523.1 cytokine receptor family member b1 isoform X1 [Cyprinus carpio]